jgi:uncharacterized membrane protein
MTFRLVNSKHIRTRLWAAGRWLVTAVELCGAELARHFPPGTLNKDELPNRLVEI